MARNGILMAAGIASLMLGSWAAADSLAPVIDGNNRFAVDLYKRLAGQDQANLIVSPLSISTALAMTYAGARGQTEKEMAETLHFSLPQDQLHAEMGELISELNDPDREGQLSVANRLWGQTGYAYRPEFLKTTHRYYGAELGEVDFIHHTESARQSINQWVEQQTHDRIKDLIPPGGVDPLTRLVLTNAIYFRGDWTHSFDPDRTRSAPFSVTDQDRIDVPMMSQEQTFRYGETPGMQILEMPYGERKAGTGGGNGVSMVVLLPTATDGLAGLEASLDSDALSRTLDQQLAPARVNVQLPKFDLTYEVGLRDTLSAMGMPTAFGDRADLTGIADDRLSITDVLHKAFVQVNEEGAEAAAATGVVVGVTSVIETKQFQADHPFLFMIRDDSTGSILFLGRVASPESANDVDTAATMLEAGDANQDLRFDQRDLVRVLQAGKYVTGQPATWGEGDWDGAPGGSPGNPPPGDGFFNQNDIIAALQAGNYLTGPQAASWPASMGSNDQKPVIAPPNAGLVAIPEPPAILLMLLAVPVLLAGRRQPLVRQFQAPHELRANKELPH